MAAWNVKGMFMVFISRCEAGLGSRARAPPELNGPTPERLCCRLCRRGLRCGALCAPLSGERVGRSA
eukprot:12936832-Prorocentrum_lima.AAC.1